MYLFIVFIFETLISLPITVYLSVVSVRRFKRLMDRHGYLIKNQTEAKKAITKMILLLGAMVTRFFDTSTSTFYRLTVVVPTLFNLSTKNILEFLKNLTALVLITCFSLNALVYLKMDKNLWKLVLKFGELKKVIKFFNFRQRICFT